MNASWKIERGTKDFSGRYIDINTDLLHCMGYEKKTQVIGRSEYDIGREIFYDTIGGSDALVTEFLKSDEKAFRGNELNALNIHMWHGVLRFRMAHKFPVRNERGKIYGVSYTAYETAQPSMELLNYYLSLEEKGLIIYEQAKKHIEVYKSNYLHSCPLNPRELQCVNLLAQGKTAKEIAQQLKLSNRTVEFYLDNARTKLQCANRYELIAKCIHKGWLDFQNNRD